MNKQQLIAAVKAGTHRIGSHARRDGTSRYTLERLTATHGWIGSGATHNATVRAAAKELTPVFDPLTSGLQYV